jgi:DNA-binding MarR family transcriptional regulator
MKDVIEEVKAILAIIGFIATVLLSIGYIIGYRFVIIDNAKWDWTAISAIGTVAAALVAAYALFTSTRLQKKIHNRDVKLTLQQKVLDIYNAYCDCCTLLNFEEMLLSARMRQTSMPVVQIHKILEHRNVIERVRNESNLLFRDDEQLKNRLSELCEGFISLSERYVNLTEKGKKMANKAFAEINRILPELELNGPHEFDKILANPQALAIFNRICTVPEVEKFNNDVRTYRNKFTYDNIDELFEKHLILVKL